MMLRFGEDVQCEKAPAAAMKTKNNMNTLFLSSVVDNIDMAKGASAAITTNTNP